MAKMWYNKYMGEIALRDKKGRFLPGQSGNGSAVITSPAQASAMARTRWDKAKRAAADGMLQGVMQSGVMVNPVDHPVAAWGAIVGRGAELLMNTDNARGYADLARFVGQAADMLPGKEAGDQAGDVVRSVAAGMVDSLLDRIQAMQSDGYANNNYQKHSENTDEAQRADTQSGDGTRLVMDDE